MSFLKTIAFDIETTGFEPDDQLTVVGFDTEMVSSVFANLDGADSQPTLEERVNEQVRAPVTISSHVDERALLEALTDFVEEKIAPQDAKLVAYNGETWRGGFDLPFVRTRLIKYNLTWPFADLPYIDAMDVYSSRFNTEGDSLPAVYDELIGGHLSELDPFDDSEEAVDEWKAGNFEAVVLHNVADIRRTRALTRLAEGYCSKSDFSMKSLDPVRPFS